MEELTNFERQLLAMVLSTYTINHFREIDTLIPVSQKLGIESICQFFLTDFLKAVMKERPDLLENFSELLTEKMKGKINEILAHGRNYK